MSHNENTLLSDDMVIDLKIFYYDIFYSKIVIPFKFAGFKFNLIVSISVNESLELLELSGSRSRQSSIKLSLNQPLQGFKAFCCVALYTKSGKNRNE